jgi:hypothetical protein
MRETTKESPVDRGEITVPGRCQICGAEGKTVAAPGAPPPNQLCPKCAIDYAEQVGADEDPE